MTVTNLPRSRCGEHADFLSLKFYPEVLYDLKPLIAREALLDKITQSKQKGESEMPTMQSFYETLRVVELESQDNYLCRLQQLAKLAANQVKAIAEGLGWQGW